VAALADENSPLLDEVRRSIAGDERQESHQAGIVSHDRVPLPPLAEQRRMVARIEELAAQIHKAHTLREEIESDLNAMLAAAHRQIAADAPRKPLSEVAPLNRRPVGVDLEKSYPAIGCAIIRARHFSQTSARWK